MQTKDIERVIRIAQKHGLRRLRVGDLEVELHAPASPPAADLDPAEVAKALAAQDDPDEVLFWSAGGAGREDTGGNPVPPPLVGEDTADAPR